MGELSIQGFTPVQYQGTVRTQRSAPAEQSQGVSRAGFTVSETLRELMSRVSRTEGQTRESRRTLQLGEGVLAEVQDRLGRMTELARQAAGGGEADRAALQREMERLWREIDRMVGSAEVKGTALFLDGDLGGEDGLEALLYAVMDGISGGEDGLQDLPDWFIQGIAADMTPEELLEGLGLDQSATGAELLAALANADLEHNPAAGRLAVLYLGAVIAGGGSPEGVSAEQALEGLRLLLEKVAQGTPPDEAVEELTGGTFTSFADLQRQLILGKAPGLQDFLTGLLLTGDSAAALPQPSLLGLLAGLEGMNLELMMGLLTASRSGEAAPPAQAAQASLAQGEAQELQRAAQDPANTPLQVKQLGEVQLMGRDLSRVSLDEAVGVLTLGGTAEVTVQGNGTQLPAIVITGSGAVILKDAAAVSVTVSAPQAQLLTAGESVLKALHLEQGVQLTLGGSGVLRLGALHGNSTNLLRLAGGAVVLEGKEGEETASLRVPVVLEGVASLSAHAAAVSSPQGTEVKKPFDLVWKALLPGWSGLTSLSVDGRTGKLALAAGIPASLWLEKGDPSHGYPIHTLTLRGRDEVGKLRTRYAYLRWSRKAGGFEEVPMYPNPFVVTGGEPGLDWEYEEEPHILHILSPAVTALSGGMGEDGEHRPFSGRIALADGIGALELALNGVSCRVSAGRAFCLGRGNDVTLMLRRGSSNHFESGEGCAGISLGDGTSLSIDCARPGGERTPAGSLTAVGRAGGAGIGRDSGPGRDRSGKIVIRGGIVTGSGSGGGAGIGAGRSCPMGPVTITGGVVSANGGSGGGAGIGGALGAPAGDISIQGGSVSATAAFHAAAIGAGIHGDCGDIQIGGTARIVRASGGNPGADIGACLFGGCGEVRISGAADLGSARLSPKTGVRLPMGGDAVTLPQFRLSAQAMQLDRMSVDSRESAREAERTLDADRRWVARIQAAYSALYERLERSRSGLYSVQRYLNQTGGPVRDSGDALSLLRGVSQSIPQNSAQAMRTHSRRSREDVRHLFQ